MAVGRLRSIWLDQPDEIEDMQSLALEFEQFFGARWCDVMVNAREPFTYHQYWEAYIALERLAPYTGDLTTTTLLSTSDNSTRFYNIILG